MSKYELETKETLLRLAEERDKYKKALEDIATLRKSTVENYPVLLSDGEMFKIAKEALKSDTQTKKY